jgi:hypothetical protein
MSKNGNSNSGSSTIKGKVAKRYFDLQVALSEFDKQFRYEGNDRAIAIVGGTFLDTILEHILWAFLVDDDKQVKKLLRYDQPLGTFSGRITMVYCLGLIYKPVRDDLHLVRKIRNEFAHDLYASFEDEKISSWCSSLKWHRISYVENPPDNATVQNLFQVGTHCLVNYLSGVVGIARGKKREVEAYL